MFLSLNFPWLHNTSVLRSFEIIYSLLCQHHYSTAALFWLELQKHLLQCALVTLVYFHRIVIVSFNVLFLACCCCWWWWRLLWSVTYGLSDECGLQQPVTLTINNCTVQICHIYVQFLTLGVSATQYVTCRLLLCVLNVFAWFCGKWAFYIVTLPLHAS